MTVWKYPLSVEASTTFVDLPKGAEILSVATIAGSPHLWALVDPDETELVRRSLITLGTGWKVVSDAPFGRFVGTITGVKGWMVFHVWDVAS